jgi:hypothetical protein
MNPLCATIILSALMLLVQTSEALTRGPSRNLRSNKVKDSTRKLQDIGDDYNDNEDYDDEYDYDDGDEYDGFFYDEGDEEYDDYEDDFPDDDDY